MEPSSRPLLLVCTRKVVCNLLSRTLAAAGTSGSTKQAWGLLEQDSIYGRLRRFMYSLHGYHHNALHSSLTGSPPLMLHPASLHILATVRCQSRGCVHRNTTFLQTPSEISPGICGMRSGYCHQYHIHNRKGFSPYVDMQEYDFHMK